MEPRAAPRRQQVDLRHLRPRPRHRRRRAGSTRSSPHDLFDYDGINESVLLDLADRRPAAQGAGPPRAQRLRLRASTGRPARCSRPTRSAHQLDGKGVDLKTGRLIADRGEEARRRQGRRATSARPRRAPRTGSPPPSRRAPGCSTSRTRTCAWTSRGWRRTTSPARRIVGANVQMYAGPGGHRGEFTAWDPVGAQAALADQGELPGLERRAGHRRRRRLLRHDGRLVQGGRRRAPARCSGSSRPAPESSASRSPTAGPTASSTSRSSPASAAGPARSSPADLDPRDPTAALGFVDAMKDLPQAHDQGRHAVCLRAAVGARRCASLARSSLLLAAGCCGGSRRDRRAGRRPRADACCASAPIRTTCRSRTSKLRGVREQASPSWSRADLHASLRYTWWPQRRGFFRNTLKAGDCDVVIGVPTQRRAGADDRARTTARPTSSSTRKDRGLARPLVRRSGPAQAEDRRAAGRRRRRQHAAGARPGQPRDHRQRRRLHRLRRLLAAQPARPHRRGGRQAGTSTWRSSGGRSPATSPRARRRR